MNLNVLQINYVTQQCFALQNKAGQTYPLSLIERTEVLLVVSEYFQITFVAFELLIYGKRHFLFFRCSIQSFADKNNYIFIYLKKGQISGLLDRN